MMRRISIFIFWCVVLTGPFHAVFAADCFKQAAQRYAVPVQLLQAIALQESGGNAHAINRNRNGSYDIGLMQINSAWLPTLARLGISDQHLFDPCVSTLVGAWILSNNFARLGYTTQGLGAYNAVSPDKREKYARQVLRRLDQLRSNHLQAAQVAALHP
jgi:soluble lytic murein transglycosylase-like protein